MSSPSEPSSSLLNRLQTLPSSPYRRWIEAGMLLYLIYAALQLRLLLTISGAHDIDTINLGAAAWRFSVLEHQPHPPGYPGYVVYLKALHAMLPNLWPGELARWGSRICSLGVIPVTFAVTRQLIRLQQQDDAPVLWRPLAAAVMATISPLLWYYGADGQSHAIEALASLVLFSGTLWVKRDGRLGSLLALVALFGLSGSLRPTIPALLSPLLLWAVWGRPLSHWFLCGGVGIVSVASWYIPLVQLAGGWDLYRRANDALVGKMFVANYSMFGSRSTPARVGYNLETLAVSFVLAALPLLAWPDADSRLNSPHPWKRLIAALTGVSAVFYSVFFISEWGYISALAALFCLVPAAWSAQPSPPVLLRSVLFVMACPLVVLAGPPSIAAVGVNGDLHLPSLATVQLREREFSLYAERICPAVEGEPTLVLSDNPFLVRARLLPWVCPPARVAIHIFHRYLTPDLDNWQIYDRLSMVNLPTPVVAEKGPPATATLPYAVKKILLAPDASDDFAQKVYAAARCAPVAGAPQNGGPQWPNVVMEWPAQCFPQLHIGDHTLIIPAAP